MLVPEICVILVSTISAYFIEYVCVYRPASLARQTREFVPFVRSFRIIPVSGLGMCDADFWYVLGELARLIESTDYIRHGRF